MQQGSETNVSQNAVLPGTDDSTPYVNMEMACDPTPDKFEDEHDEDELSMSPSIASSVMTAEGIHDVTGFHIVCLVILIGDMSRGVFFPSMWPLVSSLGGSSVTLGYSVAAFSFGRILVSPLFGSWSNTYGYTPTLLISCSILFLGTMLYTQIQNVGSTSFLIFSQIVLGIGSGTLGVTRAFVADVTAHRNRTTYMAWITAVQYAGFTVTPFVGAIFNRTLKDVDVQVGIFRWNMYTAPAYFMACVVAFTIVMLVLFFQDRVRHYNPDEKKSKKRAAIEDAGSESTLIGLTVYDCCILGCMLLNVSTKGSIAAFETMGISIAESHFGMYSAKAGTIVASCGTVGVVVLLSMGYLSAFFNDIQLICGGMVVMVLGILSLTSLDEDSSNPSWKYSFAMFMLYSVGYPVGHTAVIGLFSKLVGRRPQGTLLGWFASAGSLARLCFPIMSGYVANYSGIITLFYILTVVLTTSTLITLYNRSTLLFLSR